jgi:ribosomal protein L9
MNSKIDNRARQKAHDQFLSMVGIPRRRVLVDTSEICDEIVSQMATQILLYEEKTRGKNRIRKLLEDIKEPKFNLSELVEIIKQDVENAYKADFAYLHGPNVQLGEDNLKEIEEHKQKATTYFLERIRKAFPEYEYLQHQVGELAATYNIEHLKPKPEPSEETKRSVEELRHEAKKLVEKIEEAAQTINEARKQLDKLWREEANLLRGTKEEGRVRIKTMLERAKRVVG